MDKTIVDKKENSQNEPWYKDIWIVFLILFHIVRLILEFWFSAGNALILTLFLFANLAYITSFKTNQNFHKKLGGKLKGFILLNLAVGAFYGVSLIFANFFVNKIEPLLPDFSIATKAVFIIASFFFLIGVCFYVIIKSAKK